MCHNANKSLMEYWKIEWLKQPFASIFQCSQLHNYLDIFDAQKIQKINKKTRTIFNRCYIQGDYH